ncbi:MAG: serine/threonine protein kinase [Microcoleus sp. PH2017_22_RUC_O_B]|uniref:serine/threonine-protein kinase n=1 Tax=unclassified Microcoleus TaxID=2642155 RepID=UPI001D34B2F7|nr:MULTISPECIES: serine/threonine-protein kinase [unclassified Microcoleus]MCC3528712.1 serine/threonine protein kinase [Microcoleus sp. PH2017_21_RUC_O_A]MCC3540803.1 serine/threonine protein kinase [Microcoleus sp. PH2017_22_RUC_O_B]
MNATVLRDRYHIVKPLSAGGFGQTFLAEDWDLPSHQICVVKRFQPQSNEPFVLQQGARLFNQEVEILHRLGNHDRIPRLLAHFEENQEFYMVEEFIEGDVLSNELTRGTQKGEYQVISLLQDILEVLAFVHSQGVIHRDIKPANLIRRHSDGKIVLIDFGAVKEIGCLSVNMQGQLTPTIAIGTHGYIPDEQANGKPRFSSDVYAVGVIAIQALTGLNPEPNFGGFPEDAVTGEFQWRNAVAVSSELGSIIDRMVRKDYGQRYTSAVEVLQDLDDFFSSTKSKALISVVPILAPTQVSQPPVSFMSILSWFRSHKDTTAIAITLIALITAPFNEDFREFFVKFMFGYSYYENKEIKVKYPAEWQPSIYSSRITPDEIVFTSPKDDGFREVVTVSSKKLSKPMSSQEYYTQILQPKLKNQVNHDLLKNPEKTTLGNNPAQVLVFTTQEKESAGKNPVVLKHKLIWTVKNNQAYIVTYKGEDGNFLDDEQKVIEPMRQSFEIR